MQEIQVGKLRLYHRFMLERGITLNVTTTNQASVFPTVTLTAYWSQKQSSFIRGT